MSGYDGTGQRRGRGTGLGPRGEARTRVLDDARATARGEARSGADDGTRNDARATSRGRPRDELPGDRRSDRLTGGGERRSRGQLTRSTLWDDEDLPPGPQPLRARWDPVPPPRPKRGHRYSRPQRRRSTIGWFVHHYGWRAYALPVLAALTVIAVISLIDSSGASPAKEDASATGGVVTVTVGQSAPTTVTLSGPAVTTTVDQRPDPDSTGAGGAPGRLDGGLEAATAAASTPPVPDIDPSAAFKGVVMGVLPPGKDFARTGAGTFHIVPGTSEPLGDGPTHRTFTIEVEDGIQSAAADRAFASAVMEVLSSDRSWIGTGKFTLQRVDSNNPDFRISLTSEMTTRSADYCGWDVQLEASCYNRIPGRVVINDARWTRGAYSYDGDLSSYRVYAINHEVGHALDHHHLPCPRTGDLAPVMMQQSWSTSDDDLAKLNDGGPVQADGTVCRANPFVLASGD